MKTIKKILARLKTYYALKSQLKTLDQTFTNVMGRPMDDRLRDRVLLRLMEEMGETQDKIDNI